MKRQKFSLHSVLRYYVLQKQRTESELQQASRVLQEAEADIVSLTKEIAAVAELLHGPGAARLTTAGWIACYRKAENLDRSLTAARERRARQAAVVAKLEEQRKGWAQAEETLLSLRRAVDENNQAEAAKAQQVLVDETVLRRWLDRGPSQALDL
jgi:hypothetical protein